MELDHTSKEFKPGVRAIAVRNENYYTDGGYLDEIEHFGIGDPTARLNAFLAGDIDAMVNLPPKAIAQVEAAPGKEVWALESGAYIDIACRMDMPVSGNIDLIMAMKYLMDRERLVKGVYKGELLWAMINLLEKLTLTIAPIFHSACDRIKRSTTSISRA